jgi:hypothetical protein
MAVVERERFRTAGDRLVHFIGRKEDALAAGVGSQPVIEQALTQLGTADLHPDLAHDSLRLIEDPLDEIVAEGVQGRPHSSFLWVP